MTRTPVHNENFRFCPQAAARAGAVLTLLLSTVLTIAAQQPTDAPDAMAATYSVHSGRPLAEILLKLQQTFQSPINYEEVAYESASELRSQDIVTLGGPKKSLFTPIVDFTVPLTSADSTPYLALHSALFQYKAARLYGANGYQVIQQPNRIDVAPYQVLGANGSWHRVVPVMSQQITFPGGERTIEEALGLIASNLSSESGKKIILLTQPFRFAEKVTLTASKGMPGDLIARIAKSIGVTLSYQCLYDASDSSYYLNVYPVAATVTGNLVNNKAPGVSQPARSRNHFFVKDVTK